MWLSQKCQYALAALLELSKHPHGLPLKTGQVAEAAGVPVRFLEVILNQLKQAGFVRSRRGNDGGYALARPAHRISVGDVVRFIEGPLSPVQGDGMRKAGHRVDAFTPLWREVEKALAEVLDGTTLADLVEQERARSAPLDYAI